MPPKKRKLVCAATDPAARKPLIRRPPAGEPWYPSSQDRMSLIDATRVTVDAGFLKGDMLHTGRAVTRTEVRTGARWDGQLWRLLDDDMYLSNAYLPPFRDVCVVLPHVIQEYPYGVRGRWRKMMGDMMAHWKTWPLRIVANSSNGATRQWTCETVRFIFIIHPGIHMSNVPAILHILSRASGCYPQFGY